MRPLTEGEQRVVSHLVHAAGWVVDVPTLRAEPMNDGGMGGLRFASGTPNPKLGAVLDEVWFTDADGVPVTMTLTVDQNGELYELDVWKVDFSPLQRWPEAEDLHGPRADEARASHRSAQSRPTDHAEPGA
ncbi:MAG TPA: hypothetical protein VF576_08355 [Rubricoccaceae bacterium]|jgi:hypothetical protein